jgi:hypothetical protein
MARSVIPRRVRPDNDSAIDVVRLLEVGGCALCRVRDEAEQTWLRWFEIEHHSDAATLAALGNARGFCPAHTRRLVASDKPAILRRPWEFLLRAAIECAERLIATVDVPAAAPCPLCASADARTRAAGESLAAALEEPEAGAALRERHGLCYPHLQVLLPNLSAAQAAVAADAVRAGIAEDALTTVTGIDPDAEHRSRLSALVAEHDDPIGLPPAERLTADLDAGSCPCCRQIGRAETTYLAWLVAEEDPGDHDVALCPRHLHDAVRSARTRTRLVAARCAGVKARVEELAAAAQRLAGEQPDRPWPGRGILGRPRPDSLTDRYRRAVGNIDGDHTCRACRTGALAGDRCLALVAACAHDRLVNAALERGHGLCLRHGERLAAQELAQGAVRRLATRLRQSAWEVHEDTLKQAWDLRHEPAGSETTVWRRVPTIVDGRAYLGLSEAEVWR